MASRSRHFVFGSAASAPLSQGRPGTSHQDFDRLRRVEQRATTTQTVKNSDKANLRCKLLQKWYIVSMAWTVQFLDDGVRAALEALPRDIRARFERIVNLIQTNGLERVREPYVKHLEGGLWEMRMKGKDGIARAAYVTATGHRVVVVHVFVKKTQKTPRREIETALRRAKEVK
jgi:phage-related protein